MNLKNYIANQDILPLRKLLTKKYPDVQKNLFDDFFEQNEFFQNSNKDIQNIENKFLGFLQQSTQSQNVIPNQQQDNKNNFKKKDSSVSNNNSQVGFLDYFEKIENPKLNVSQEDNENLNE